MVYRSISHEPFALGYSLRLHFFVSTNLNAWPSRPSFGFPAGSFCIIVLAWLQAEQMFSFMRIELSELTVY
jgi:hypothetical protein